MHPLCLGIDGGANAGIGLVEPISALERPRLLVVRAVPKMDSANAWAERIFYAMAAVAKAAAGRPVLGWWELTCPPKGNGWIGINALGMRRGQLLQAAADAGINIDGFERVMVQTWTSILSVPPKKLGDGSHRITEAERLVEMDPATFRGLGPAAVDAAEGVEMACARAYRLLGMEKPKKARAKKGKTA